MQQNESPDVPKKLPRRQSSLEFRHAQVDKWKQSGLSMSEYCRQHDLSVSSLSAWVRSRKDANRSFKAIKMLTPPAQPLLEHNTVEIIVDNRIRIRMQNVRDAVMIVNITRDLMACS